MAFLGTVGSDGSPRIHPFIPAVLEGDLWAFVIQSPKQRDLDRAARFAIHCRRRANDEWFFCGGGSLWVDVEDARSRVAGVMPYTDIDDRHLLDQFRLSKALWTTWPTPTSPVHRGWVHRRH